MKKKMPESHPTHVYDKRARRNLEDIFPEHWKLNKLEEFHSGIEYGDDWICEVVDEKNVVTGARFYIQSKSTEKKLGKTARRLGMPFNVSTLNRLHVMNMPVMLHYYHQPSNRGFWMWLDEFYLREYKTSWENRETIDVYILTKNLLNETSVKRIMSDVFKYQRVHHLQNQVETANKIDENFGFHFTTTAEYTEVGIYAKHPDSLENHPIAVNLTLDANSDEIMRRMTELGVPGQFEAAATYEGLPQWLVEDIDEEEKAVVYLFPHVEESPSHLQFEYLDEHNNILFKSKLVEMKLVQAGTKYKRYEGESKVDPLIFTIIFDAIKPQTKFSVAHNGDRRVETRDWYYDLLDHLIPTKTAKICNLDTGQDHLLENYSAFTKSNDISPIVRQFTKNLAIISKALNLDILVPEESQEISQNDLLMAQASAEAIQTGITYILTNIPKEILQSNDIPVLITRFTVTQINPLIEDFKANGQVYIPLPAFFTIPVLNYSFDLGSAEYYCLCTSIQNLADLEQSVEVLNANTELDIRLVIDVSKSYMQFNNWIHSRTQNDNSI